MERLLFLVQIITNVHHCQDWHQVYLKLSIAGAESEIGDSYEGRQERLDDDGDEEDDDVDEEGLNDEEEDDDDGDDGGGHLDVVLESVGDQGLTEEGGDAGQHSRSWEKHHRKYDYITIKYKHHPKTFPSSKNL